ncbi:hypothetical protein BLAT2472_130075 [Burkholderia latens]
MTDLELAILAVDLPETRAADRAPRRTVDDHERHHGARRAALQRGVDIRVDRPLVRHDRDLQIPQLAVRRSIEQRLPVGGCKWPQCDALAGECRLFGQRRSVDHHGLHRTVSARSKTSIIRPASVRQRGKPAADRVRLATQRIGECIDQQVFRPMLGDDHADAIRKRARKRPHVQVAPDEIERGQRIDDRGAEPLPHERAHRHGRRRLDHRTRRDAELRERLVDQDSVRVVQRQAYERAIGEIGKIDRMLADERMPVGQHAYFVDFQQWRKHGAGRRDVVLGQPDVVALRGQPLFQHRRLLRRHRHADARMRVVKAPACAGQDRMRKRRQRDHRQLSVAKLAQPRGGGRDTLEPHIRQPHVVEQRERGHRRPQPSVRALEQREADDLLHPRELAADRRLRRIEHLGRARRAAGHHQRAEDLDVPVCQHGRLIYIKNESNTDKQAFYCIDNQAHDSRYPFIRPTHPPCPSIPASSPRSRSNTAPRCGCTTPTSFATALPNCASST